MKKILILIFILLNFYHPILASDRPSYYFQPLPLKDGELKKVGLYNIYIKDYNKFKSEFDTEVFDFCSSLMIPGGGVRQYTQETKCIYNTAIDQLTKHKLRGIVDDNLYSHHKNLFALAKTSALAISRCNNRSCQVELIDNFVDRWFRLDKKLFSDFDRLIKDFASEEQAKLTASRN
tara:strand:- start:67 stop:597 length:531 start_codon:yes stop_codon:yes gene_type:complete